MARALSSTDIHAAPLIYSEIILKINDPEKLNTPNSSKSQGNLISYLGNSLLPALGDQSVSIEI